MKFIANVKVVLVSLLVTIILTIPGYAKNTRSAIAVLKSLDSQKEYNTKHIGNYDELFQDVTNSINNANINYEIISDENIINDNIKDRYKVIILPLTIRLSDEAISKLKDFTYYGGKLIVSEPGGEISSDAKELATIVGVSINNVMRLEKETQINWLSGMNPEEGYFPPSTRVALIAPHAQADIIAKWDESNVGRIPAIVRTSKGAYFGWSLGSDGSISFNAFALKHAIDKLVPGLTAKETIELSENAYINSIKEINKLQSLADGALSTAQDAGLSSPINQIQEKIYLAEVHKAMFKSTFSEKNYGKAKQEYNLAKKNIIEAYASSIPSRMVEGRALWLDRGTIVSYKDRASMKKLFDRIEQAGINVVYFETINAGYPVYPSKYIKQNPLTEGCDPLKYAIEEAHSRNIELHAWTWIFAVGNTRHNPLIGKPESYPGPVISDNFFDGAMLGQHGNLLPVKQTEYWLNPANPDVQRFLLNVLEEIATNYDIDGLQLDYIRYPFQSQRNLMGFDYAGKEQFYKETGLSLDKLDSNTLNTFTRWKSDKVSDFVKAASTSLRSIKPDIQISAAVYSMPKPDRIRSIQQDWERWAEEGWIDSLSPMSYASNTEKLSRLASYVQEATNHKALVYPGLAIRRTDTAGFLEQLDTVRSLGLVGNTIFAMAHLNNDKLNILQKGPYRNKSKLTPGKNPIMASKVLLEGFMSKVDVFIEKGTIFSLSKDDEIRVKSKADLLYEQIQTSMANPTVENIERARIACNDLMSATEEWLSLENGLRPGKARLLNDYLNQLTSLLAYAKHKQQTNKRVSRTAMK